MLPQPNAACPGVHHILPLLTDAHSLAVVCGTKLSHVKSSTSSDTTSNYIIIKCRDHEYIDGDRIRLMINGSIIYSNISLTYDNNTFVSTTGDTAGIKVKYSGLGANATVYYGESLISKFTTYISSVLETSGVLNNRVSTLTDEVSDQNVLIADLDEKFEATRSRYVQQFTAMEQAVTSMKNTGDYLTNLFEAMNKDN